MVIVDGIENKDCIGMMFTCSPNPQSITDPDGYYDVTDRLNRILYCIGECIKLIAFDEEREILIFSSDYNECPSVFQITYRQFLRDFKGQ